MIISTRMPPSITSFSHLENSGTWKMRMMSAAITASSVPLHWPIVGTPTLGPARDGVDAHLVDVGAHFVGGGKRRLDVFATGAEIADDGDGLALLHLRHFELLSEQIGQPTGIELLNAQG